MLLCCQVRLEDHCGAHSKSLVVRVEACIGRISCLFTRESHKVHVSRAKLPNLWKGTLDHPLHDRSQHVEVIRALPKQVVINVVRCEQAIVGILYERKEKR